MLEPDVNILNVDIPLFLPIMKRSSTLLNIFSGTPKVNLNNSAEGEINSEKTDHELIDQTNER